MPNIVVRNIPDHLHALLKARAEHNHRSVTREVVHLIESGLDAAPVRRPLPAPVRFRSGRVIDIDEFETAVVDGQR